MQVKEEKKKKRIETRLSYVQLTPDSAFLSKSLLGGSGKVMKKQWYSKGVFMARCLAKRPVSSDLCDLRFPLYLMLHLKKKYFHVINQIKAVRVTGYLVSAGIAFSCCCLSFCPRLYCLYSKPTRGLNLNKKTFWGNINILFYFYSYRQANAVGQMNTSDNTIRWC